MIKIRIQFRNSKFQPPVLKKKREEKRGTQRGLNCHVRSQLWVTRQFLLLSRYTYIIAGANIAL
jgi:hypothetical protein